MQTANKALNKLGAAVPEGGQCLEDEKYRIWQNREILTITAKDNRGEILRLENGKVEGNLSSEDVEAFQIFEQSLNEEVS